MQFESTPGTESKNKFLKSEEEYEKEWIELASKTDLCEQCKLRNDCKVGSQVLMKRGAGKTVMEFEIFRAGRYLNGLVISPEAIRKMVDEFNATPPYHSCRMISRDFDIGVSSIEGRVVGDIVFDGDTVKAKIALDNAVIAKYGKPAPCFLVDMKTMEPDELRNISFVPDPLKPIGGIDDNQAG